MKISRILKIAFSNPKLPSSLILLITGKCNSKCNFCFFKDSLNTGKDLSLTDIEKVSRSLGRLFKLYISGGEPFLRDDIAQICQIFVKNNAVDEITIPTNGLMPPKVAELSQKIIDSCPKTHVMVSLSLDGLPELHDRLRGVPGSFEKVIETYHKLIELKKKNPDLRVHVTTTVSKFNYDQMPQLIELVKERMPELNSHNFEFIRNRPDKTCEDLPTLAQCQDFGKLHKKLVNETKGHFKSKYKSKLANIVTNYKFDVLLNIIEQEKQVIPCVAGKNLGVVDWEGNVYLCELLPKIGNIKEANFKDIWQSKQADEQRKSIAEKKCFCTHSCFQGTNILFQPKNYFKIIWYYLKNG